MLEKPERLGKHPAKNKCPIRRSCRRQTADLPRSGERSYDSYLSSDTYRTLRFDAQVFNRYQRLQCESGALDGLSAAFQPIHHGQDLFNF